MDPFTLFLISIGERIFSDKIVPKINALKSVDKPTLAILILASSFGISIPSFINEVASGTLLGWQFFAIIGMITGYFGYITWTMRKRVMQKMRYTYYSCFALFTYIFVATEVVMYMAMPFMPKSILF